MAWPLMQEHGYLGASLEDGRVMSYMGETPVDEALLGACVIDLTGNLCRFVSGEGSPGYMEALCAGSKLAAGSCTFSAVLTGDGALVSVPLVARGGEHEYMVLDTGARRESLYAWMGFVQSIERNGRTPYASVSVEDAACLLVPLLLCGERAAELISDYTANQALPAEGKVASVAFDGVPCVLSHLGGFPADAYAVFVPPAFSTRLFRSFLSFAFVHPLGMESLGSVMERLPWTPSLAGDDRVEVDPVTLSSWGILRPEADYIGARRG